MKKGGLAWMTLWVYGQGVVLGCTFTILIMMCSSVKSGYKILVLTNNYSECWIEIVLILTGFIAYFYTVLRRPGWKKGGK